MVSQERRRLLDALRVYLGEIHSLSSRLEQVTPEDTEQPALVAAEWVSLRSRILQQEAEALAFVVYTKIGAPDTDDEIQQFIGKSRMKRRIDEGFKKETQMAEKIQSQLKKGPASVRQAALGNLKHMVRIWQDRLELDWLPTLEQALVREAAPQLLGEEAELLGLLRKLDPSLPNLYLGARIAAESDDPDSARQSISSSRELLSQVLRAAVPGNANRKEKIKRMLGSDTDSVLGDALGLLGDAIYQSMSKRDHTQATCDEARLLLRLTSAFLRYLLKTSQS